MWWHARRARSSAPGRAGPRHANEAGAPVNQQGPGAVQRGNGGGGGGGGERCGGGGGHICPRAIPTKSSPVCAPHVPKPASCSEVGKNRSDTQAAAELQLRGSVARRGFQETFSNLTVN